MPSDHPTHYLDFDLEIGPGEGRAYPVSVLHSPAGEARTVMQFPFEELRLELQLQKLQTALLRSGGQRRSTPSPEQRAVQDFGQALFDALISGEVRSRYDVSRQQATNAGQGLRLKLRIRPPEMAVLPWEYLYDGRADDYLCLSRNTPIIRYPELAQTIQPLRVPQPLRILGLVADPSDMPRLDVEQEKERVVQALAPLKGEVTLTWLAGSTAHDLQRALRGGPWHIFHFVGHGGFDRQSDEGLVVLTNDAGRAQPLFATPLARLLADHDALRLVVLNACEGARGSERDIFASAAAILVRRGVPAVLAMQHEITDHAAVEFARAFYEAVADGFPVDAAVSEGRKAVSNEVPNTVEWGTPVLTMRAPDGILFDITESVAHEARQAELKRQAEAAEREQQERAARARQAELRRQQEVAEREQQERAANAARQAELKRQQEAAERERQERAAYAAQQAELNRQAEAAEREQQERAAPSPAPRWRGLSGWRDMVGLGAVAAALLMLGVAIWGSRGWIATTTPIAGTTRGRQIDGAVMVYVPAGEFTMGSADSDSQADSDEKPQHRVTVAGFWIDRTEVTNAQYRKFVEAGGYNQQQYWTEAGWAWKGQNNATQPTCWGDGNLNQAAQPVVCVSWHEAYAYAKWAGGRLPTEAEWEKAARGPDGRNYPWGNTWDGTRVNFCDQRCRYDWKDAGVDDGYAYTAPVGSYPNGVSPYGALDLTGNVWEWVSSKYSSYPYRSDDGREDQSSTDNRVLRGGSWCYVAGLCAPPTGTGTSPATATTT